MHKAIVCTADYFADTMPTNDGFMFIATPWYPL